MKFRVGDRVTQVYPDTRRIIPRMPVKVLIKKLKYEPVKGWFVISIENGPVIHPMYPQNISPNELNKHYIKVTDLGAMLYEPSEPTKETTKVSSGLYITISTPGGNSYWPKVNNS